MPRPRLSVILRMLDQERNLLDDLRSLLRVDASAPS
jgi:hypothetical protein